MQIISGGVMQEEQIDDFDNFYYYHILPVLRRYEKIRQRDFYMFLFVVFFIVFSIIFSFCYFIKFGASFAENILQLEILFGTILFIYVVDYYHNKFKSGVKARCSEKIKKCFNSLEWGATPIDESILKQSELFGEYSAISFDDCFKGKYKGVDFLISETYMKYEMSKKYGNKYSIFNGVIVSFCSNKKINAKTIVISKGDPHIRNCNVQIEYFKYFFLIVSVVIAIIFPMLIIVPILVTAFLVCYEINNYIKNKKLQNVTLEDLNFDKRFSVYSSNQIEARYLITPSFMERLNNLRTSFGTKKIKCAFFDDRIVFAISTNKDLFELGDFHRSLINKKKVKEFYDEIMAIYNMIDYFKLSEKTGL